jgi:hypothetical protein
MSAPSYFNSARQVVPFLPLGFIGDFGRSIDFRSITGTNSAPQAEQVTTVTVPGSPDADTDYTVTIDGEDATFTTESATTQDELGAGLAAAINANPATRGKMSASYSSSTNTLTLTGRYPGISYTVSINASATTADLGTPTTATSADAADPVGFGLVVAGDGTYTAEGTPKVFVPTTSDFDAQVISLTFTTNAGGYFFGTVTVGGKVYNWHSDHNTDLDTTCTDIAAAINAVLPTETVIAASVGSGGGVVTLTAEVEGADFEATVGASGHASATAAKAYTTGPSISTSLRRAMKGISVRRLDVENQTAGGDDPAYAANAGVEICTRGAGWVERDAAETWTEGSDTYVSLASATKGRVYNTAGTDRVWIGRDKIAIERGERSTTSDGIGRVRIDMGA